MSKLFVGAGKVCINPTSDLMPFPNWEGHSYEAIYDDCFCRSIVIDNGEKVAAIVAFDLGMPPVPAQTKKLISEATGISTDNIMLSATHNHTAAGIFTFSKDPEANRKADAYRELVLKAAVESVKQAKAAMKPAKYGFGEGKSYINVNRDRLFEDGYWMQSTNFEGYSDKTIAIIKFVDMEGNLICALMNYAMHAVEGFITPDIDGKVKISGNIPGVACDYVEKRFGKGAVAMWTSGAAGNQNPIIAGPVSMYEEDGYSEYENLPNGAAYVLLRHFGQTHAIDAIKTLNSIHCESENMTITLIDKKVKLPAQKAPEGADMELNRLLADNLVRFVRGVQERPEKKLVEMLDDSENPVELPLQLAILGDIALFGVAAEIYNEIGRDCKAASPFKKTIVVTHTDNSIGYILDKTSKDKKVFQSFGRVKPGICDEIIVNAMLEMFKDCILK